MQVEWGSLITYVVGALVVSILVALVRWALKIDRGLSNTVKSAATLVTRLDGHERLDDERHAATEVAIARLYDMALASKDRR
jgi:hypothetical protein